jgi:hypothetical protein
MIGIIKQLFFLLHMTFAGMVMGRSVSVELVRNRNPLQGSTSSSEESSAWFKNKPLDALIFAIAICILGGFLIFLGVYLMLRYGTLVSGPCIPLKIFPKLTDGVVPASCPLTRQKFHLQCCSPCVASCPSLLA